MSEESQNNNIDNESEHGDHDSTEPKSTETIAIVNAALAYIHYGISSATPDNVMEVVLGQFTAEEIIHAKNMMWRECQLGNPAPRNNTEARKASEAHLHDILDEIYKVDTTCYAFMVESDGIARLPRFNADCLNVVSIDTRIAELKEKCFALKIESSSYRLEVYLWTNDNQFSFKSVHSTDLCIYDLSEFIEYFKSRSTSVYVAFLDASKAFDKISHWTLFRKLIDRGVPLYLVIILCYWYQKQEMTVRWGVCISDSFKITNDVRQGGTLSPQLFNIYIDGLSDILNKSSVGGSIGGKRINHMLYLACLAERS